MTCITIHITNVFGTFSKNYQSICNLNSILNLVGSWSILIIQRSLLWNICGIVDFPSRFVGLSIFSLAGLLSPGVLRFGVFSRVIRFGIQCRTFSRSVFCQTLWLRSSGTTYSPIRHQPISNSMTPLEPDFPKHFRSTPDLDDFGRACGAKHP